jgi:glycosyltransferase involved in cell wall biosynthesis
MPKQKVLYVVHNHPSLFPGGAETYALELYEAMRSSSVFEPLLVARIGPNHGGTSATLHPGSPFTALSSDPNQYYLFTDQADYDFFYGKHADKSLYTTQFANFLRAHEPDIVHFQHTLFMGYDLLSVTRHVLPDAAILYTLQEYLPICNHDGQLVRRWTGEMCSEPSPRRCCECFPERSPQSFFMRERFIKSQLAHVDLFLAPSRFLLERYLDWGIPAEKLRFEDYGRRPKPRLPEEDRRSRTRLGFFGQINRFKGLDVLLRALRLLRDSNPDVHLWIFGANLDMQESTFRQQISDLIEANEGAVAFSGPYEQSALPRLMAFIDWVVVPSLWWENSPLVIQEAFMQGRPVICSGVGGMAEKVTEGVNGLHFESGDASSLARTIARGVSTPGLWETLREGIPPVFSMDEHVDNLTELYREIRSRRGASEAKMIATA